MKIVHETDRQNNQHRLIVGDLIGRWVGHQEIARCGHYAATTEVWGETLPRMFQISVPEYEVVERHTQPGVRRPARNGSRAFNRGG